MNKPYEWLCIRVLIPYFVLSLLHVNDCRMQISPSLRWLSTLLVRVSSTSRSLLWTWEFRSCSSCLAGCRWSCFPLWALLIRTSGCTFCVRMFSSRAQCSSWRASRPTSGRIPIRALKNPDLWRINLALVSPTNTTCHHYSLDANNRNLIHVFRSQPVGIDAMKEEEGIC